MTPATHVAIGGVLARRVRNPAAALAAAFGAHFAADAIYHFEAFYPLSVPGGWTSDTAMLVLFVVLGLLAIPFVIWILRKDRQVGLFACYGLLMSLLPFDGQPIRQLAWALLLTGSWCALSPSAEMRLWTLCGFAGYIPDVLKKWIGWVAGLHETMHYGTQLDLGDWMSLLLRGRWRIPGRERIYDFPYQLGYALEILLEGAILFGCFWLLVRWRAARSVANLAAIDHQRRAVDEGSLVRK